MGPEFYAGGLDRRIEYPGVARPRAAGLLIGQHRPVFYHGRRVVAHVPHCGFGFFTPVLAPYPVPVYEPYPVYSSTMVIAPAPAYPPPVYAAPPPGYADNGYGYAGGYGEAPPFAGPAGQPQMEPPVAEGQDQGYVSAEEGARPQEAAPLRPQGEQPQTGAEEAAQPNLIERQMAEGMEAFAAGDYDKAGRIFLQAGMADKDNIDAWLAYAVARFATRDYEAASLAARRAIRAFPDVVNSPVNIRERYGQQADFDRQVAAIEEHLRVRPEDADGWLVLGFVRHFSDQRELAARTFDVIQRRFEADRDIAETFLKAKPPSQVESEASPEGAPGTMPPIPPGPAEESQEAPAPPPPPPPPPAGESSDGPVGSALESEQVLRAAGLTE